MCMVLLASSPPLAAHAHATISAGDLAVISVSTNAANGPVGFSFVTLEAFHPVEVVIFTDRGWLASPGRFRPGEGEVYWDVDRLVSPGTVVEISGAGGLPLNPGGDQVVAFVGALMPDGTPTDTLIFGLNLGGPWAADATSDQTSALPPSLSGFELALEGGMDCAYGGPTVGTRSEMLAWIRDPAQWSCSDSERARPPAAFTVYRDPGARCSTDEECGPDVFCAYGVCCETECRRAAIGHCNTCEAGTGRCIASPAGTLCRAPGGPCDPADLCDGVGVDCPSNALAGPATVCREAAAACDPEERCTGDSRECPADVTTSPGAECRASTGPCDPAERCDADELECPPDVFEPDGIDCDDGLVCTASSSCVEGRCAGPVPLACDDSDVCTADACSDTGGCANEPIPGCCRDDAECDDADPCVVSRCEDHLCVATPSGLCDGGGPMDAGVESDAGAASVGGGGCGVAGRRAPPPWLFLGIALALARRR